MSRDVAARREEGVRMGGVASAFTAADGSRKKAFIPFVTCGDPSIGLSEQVVRAMESHSFVMMLFLIRAVNFGTNRANTIPKKLRKGL